MDYRIMEECKNGKITFSPYKRSGAGIFWITVDGGLMSPDSKRQFFDTVEEAQLECDKHHRKEIEHSKNNWTKYHEYDPS